MGELKQIKDILKSVSIDDGYRKEFWNTMRGASPEFREHVQENVGNSEYKVGDRIKWKNSDEIMTVTEVHGDWVSTDNNKILPVVECELISITPTSSTEEEPNG